MRNALTDIAGRFRRLDFVTKRQAVIHDEPDVIDPHMEQLELARDLATTKQYLEGLKPILERRLEELEWAMQQNIGSHPLLAECQGRKNEVRNILNILQSEGE